MKRTLLATLAVMLLLSCGCTWFGDDDAVFVLHAGSLSYTFAEIIHDEYEDEGVYDLRNEGHGSTKAAHMIIDDQRQPDVFISASPSAVELLFAENLADWYITLAAEELVIAYIAQGMFEDDLEAADEGHLNWTDVLTEPDFRLGRTDPDQDPKGFRTVILGQLASIYYDNPDLGADLFGGPLNPDQIRPEPTLFTMLEVGELDAVVAYRHEAVERGLPFLELPAVLNLGDPSLAEFYAQASYEDRDGVVHRGEPIVFVITQPDGARHAEGGLDFISFMLSSHGQSLLVEAGFSTIEATVGGDASAVPASLKSFVSG